MAMQATVRAKGHKPSRSGLLAVLLVFAVGLALGALVWNVFEDDSTISGNDAAVRAPAGGVDGHGEGGLRHKYAESVSAIDGPNSITRDEVIDTGQARVAVQVETHARPREQYRLYNGRASDDVIKAHHSEFAGDGVLGGFPVIEPELPMAFHAAGMGEGWLATGKTVDERIAHDPVAPLGIGYFA